MHERTSDRYDVLVIGAGPSGAAAAYWLAERGRRVLVVEKKRFPRDKTCGDGLTPRAVRQLHDMGLADPLSEFQRFDGLRSIAHGVTLELAWPEHPDFPGYGYVVRRSELDQMVAENAVKAGATLWPASEAVAPVLERGILDGAVVRSAETGASEVVRARYVIVADGANSRFGRALGTARNRSYPLGMAIRGYFTSPYHDEPWIESHLDLRDRDGNHLPGYGWIFPVGDGTVNVGVGLLSTFRGWKDVNTSHLMEAFCETAPARWGIGPDTADLRSDRGEAPDRHVGAPGRRAQLRRRGRRGRNGQPVQRRGHLGRVRDRPASRPTPSTSPWPPATGSPSRPTPNGSTRSTASTSRSPAPSCRPSAIRP